METQLNPLLLIKPKGITSFFAVNELKKVLPKKIKIGHCGTLDPMAEGLMIILIGRDQTKLQSVFLNLNKKYIASITFGVTSNTYDIDINSVLSFSNNIDKIRTLSLENVKSVLTNSFKGEILQTVPAFSAVKVSGKRLYKSAYEGKKVELPSRKIKIYSYKILDFINNYSGQKNRIDKLPTLQVEFEVSKGTYIRSIANDLGNLVGTGAVLSGLQRTEIGKFKLKDALTIDKAKDYLKSTFQTITGVGISWSI